MPIPFINSVVQEGTGVIPFYDQLKVYGPALFTAGLLKRYFSGATNTWERKMNGSVVMITGGTSGLGAVTAHKMAASGAQVILLVREQNEWLYEFIEDMREATGNALIYAEECDLADLHSVRQFATRWLDNSPPRRLDMVICCAGSALPPFSPRQATADGIEHHLQVNYIGHYQLLTLLLPAIRVQPPGRDVRIILASCIANVMADFDIDDLEFTKRGYPTRRPWRVLGQSKLALTMLGYELQRQLNAYERPDKMPMSAHVCVVDPGMMRSPSFKRFASLGEIWGLILYLIFWPVWYIFLKSSAGGAENVTWAAMSPEPQDRTELSYISECRIRAPPPRSELTNEALQKDLFEFTAKFANDAEKKSVMAKKRMEGDIKQEEPVSASASASTSTSASTAKPKSKKSRNRKKA